MAQADVVADLKRSLHDSATVFTAADDADFVRFLALALLDMAWKRPLTGVGQVVLVAGQARYPLTTYPDFANYKTHMWGTGACLPKPWEPGYPGALPRVASVQEAGGPCLAFDPAPSAAHLAVLGSTFKFWYAARHVLAADAAQTTVAPQDRGLLLLRAQAEAMREMALRNLGKPVQMRDGLSGAPRNSTPAALYETLLHEFMEAH